MAKHGPAKVNGDGDMSREEFDQALPAIMKLMEEEEVNVPKKEKGGNLTRQIHYFNRILSGFAI